MNPTGNAHEIHALTGAYVVDALDPEERVRFEEHLAACTVCQEEVANLREAAASLGGTAPAQPPAGLRDRLLSEIRTVRPLPPEPAAPQPAAAGRTVRALPLRRRLTALVAAASLIGVAGVGTVVWQGVTSSDHSTSVAERVLRASDAERVDVTLDGGGTASVVRSISEGNVVLITRDMPAAPTDHVYELWLQRPDGAMVPAGLMTGGNTTVVLEGDIAAATAAGITVEPKGGSESPTTAPIALFELVEPT